MKRSNFGHSSLSAIFLIFTVCLFGLSVYAAQSDDNFFAGKTIRIIAASSPGGGTDSLARLQARHFGKHVPGNPRVIVVNMPGAGGMIGANYLYNRAKPDGLTMGSINTGLVYREALGDRGVKFKLDKFTYLGQIASGGQMIYVRADTPFTSFDAIRKSDRKPKMGAQSKAHNSNVVLKMVEEVFPGVDFDVVVGYPGTAEILLDIERGALDGRAHTLGSLLSTRKDWLDSGFIRPLAIAMPERDPRSPNTPTLAELAPPENVSLLDGIYAVQGRWIAMPPNVPAKRTKILRDAFAAMLVDPEFIKDAERIGWNVSLVRGEDLNQRIERVIGNEKLMNFFRRILTSP